MSAAIHYAVKAKLIRRKKDDGELDFLEVDKDFFNENPILAREAAFKFYQNYIDVLLEAKGLRYESDRQARAALETFHDPGTSTRITINGSSFDYPDSFGNGIGVFIVVDVPSESKEHDLTYADNLALIHGIGFLEDSDRPESILTGLEHEIFYYNLHGYNKEDCESKITFCNPYEWLEGYREDEPGTYTILKTPFDWTGMDEPYWWGETEAEKKEREPYQSQTYEEIVADGETDQVEFKPALLYNFKTKNAGIGVKGIIAKSICGFLNAKGGLLFIGVSDKGKPQGLSYDFSLAEDENFKDYFRLQFDDTIKQFLPISIKGKISGEFISIDGIEIFVVIVFPSTRGPVFMNGQHGKEFWVRWTASTRLYTDIEEITNYCLEHWNSKEKNNE